MDERCCSGTRSMKPPRYATSMTAILLTGVGKRYDIVSAFAGGAFFRA